MFSASISLYPLQQDRKWFEDAISRVVREHLGEEYLPCLGKDQYFVDFMRDPEEPTGEEDSGDIELEMPHVYETIPSWDGLRERLNFFMHQYNEQVSLDWAVPPQHWSVICSQKVCFDVCHCGICFDEFGSSGTDSKMSHKFRNHYVIQSTLHGCHQIGHCLYFPQSVI